MDSSATTFIFFTSFTAWFSYIFGTLSFQFAVSQGWTGSFDAFALLCVLWVIVATGIGKIVTAATIVDVRRPLWVRYLRDALKYLSIIYGFFVTFYFTDLMQQVDFSSLTWPEMLLLLGSGIVTVLAVQTGLTVILTGKVRDE